MIYVLPAIALGEINSFPELAIPALKKALQDEDLIVSDCATKALGKIGSEVNDGFVYFDYCGYFICSLSRGYRSN